MNPLELGPGQLQALVWRLEHVRKRAAEGASGVKPEQSPQRMRMRRQLGIA